jgi:hypothetical protein
VNHSGNGTGQREDRLFGADGCNPVADNRDRFGDGGGVVEGQDTATSEDRIGGSVGGHDCEASRTGVHDDGTTNDCRRRHFGDVSGRCAGLVAAGIAGSNPGVTKPSSREKEE